MKICYIGGYELLKDGTQTSNIKNIDELITYLLDYEVYIDQKIIETATDDKDMFRCIEKIWQNRNNNGGGSGWFENAKNFNTTGLLDKAKETEWVKY